MNSMPSLSFYNRFDILPIEQINDIETKTQDVQNPDPPSTSTLIINSYAQTCCSKWEKLLPKKFIIAATEGNPTSLKLKVEIKTTDTAEKKSVSALVDCGATGEFIDRHYAKSSCFNLVKLTQPIPVYNVDGTLNEAGSIISVLKSGLVWSLGPKMGNRQLQPQSLVAYFGATTTKPLKTGLTQFSCLKKPVLTSFN